jgi:outer membrane protein assembly factor BamA
VLPSAPSISRWLLCAALAWLCACTPARREVETNLTRHVNFEGNGGALSGHGDYVLRGQMEQEVSGLWPLTWPFMYLAKPAELQPDALPRDAYRIEIWYAHHGWFDARVVGWSGIRIRDRRGKAAAVWDLRGVVEPGAPTFFREFEVEGLVGTNKLFASAVRRTSDVQEGYQFNLDSVQTAQDVLLKKLYDHAYPYATLEREIDVYPEAHVADVLFRVDSGESADYGEVQISGTDKVPDWLIKERVERSGLSTGQGYKLSDLDFTRRELFDLQTFSIVSVEPDLSDRTLREVPIQVRLTESKFRTLRFGVGLLYDTTTVQPRISSRFRHVNLLNRVIRFDLNSSIGLAYRTVQDEDGDAYIDTQSPFLTYNVTGKLLFPRLFHPDFNLEAAGAIEQELQSGLFGFRRPSADLSLLWQPPKRGPKDTFRVIQLRIGPHVEQYRYLDLTPASEVQARRLFGKGFQNPYELFVLNETLSWDSRDGTRENTQLHTRGTYFSLGLRESIPVGPQGFFFGGVTAELRRYTKLKLSRDGRSSYPLVLAGKAKGTIIQAFGGSAVPYPERAFMGGPNSIRGFRTGQVGPYEILCDGDDLFILPRGGTIAAEASGELRYDWAYGLKLALFVDGGLLAEDWASLGADDLRISAGTGFRYDTPVGPFRFDISFRRLYPEDLAASAYTKCADRVTTLASGKDVLLARPYDLFSNWQTWRGTRDRPPLAVVFFLAIGEAI